MRFLVCGVENDPSITRTLCCWGVAVTTTILGGETLGFVVFWSKKRTVDEDDFCGYEKTFCFLLRSIANLNVPLIHESLSKPQHHKLQCSPYPRVTFNPATPQISMSPTTTKRSWPRHLRIANVPSSCTVRLFQNRNNVRKARCSPCPKRTFHPDVPYIHKSLSTPQHQATPMSPNPRFAFNSATLQNLMPPSPPLFACFKRQQRKAQSLIHGLFSTLQHRTTSIPPSSTVRLFQNRNITNLNAPRPPNLRFAFNSATKCPPQRRAPCPRYPF